MSHVRTFPEPLPQLVDRVCRRVPPSFKLADFVAVSPFVGYAEQPFLDAHAAMERRLHADLLPDLETFRAWFAEGRFDASDVAAATDAWNDARNRPKGAPRLEAAQLLKRLESTPSLDGPEGAPRRPELLSVAGLLDHALETRFVEDIVEDIARLCSELYDRGVARIASPLFGRGLYDAFREVGVRNHPIEARGLTGFRALVRELPEDPDEALEQLLGSMDLGKVSMEDYLGRLLAEVKGWAGALRAEKFSSDPQDVGSLRELLLVRLVYDVALARSSEPEGFAVPRTPFLLLADAADEIRHDVALRYLLLTAAERGFHRHLSGEFASATEVERALALRERPAVQAVFCIDVRSEPFRRALEAASSTVETYGFAGFFGMPIAVQTPGRHDAQPQCPALLSPAMTLACEPHERPSTLGTQLADLLADFRQAANGSFSYVETLGFGALATMLREALGFGRTALPETEALPVSTATLDADTGLALATSALTNLGLRAPYGRLVVLVAHDATSANDPLRAGLSCGACAGHGGAPNARLLASLLNDRSIRARLVERGFELPEDCHVLAAVHDTTTDHVRLLDAQRVPLTHHDDLRTLETALGLASQRTRHERAPRLTGMGEASTASPRLFEARAHDWSEVRPEWGLAGNAAFIAARRERTRGVDLGGRVFLHSYDRTLDADGSVLKLILNAPVVVASFINLQYYGSTVAKEQLGSGTKTLHNVSGGVGVVQGNGGDLAIGLSLQSVSDGQRDRHEPLRLQVYIEDTVERIAGVLDVSPTLAAMVENEYLLLYSLDPTSDRIERVRQGSLGTQKGATP